MKHAIYLYSADILNDTISVGFWSDHTGNGEAWYYMDDGEFGFVEQDYDESFLDDLEAVIKVYLQNLWQVREFMSIDNLEKIAVTVALQNVRDHVKEQEDA